MSTRTLRERKRPAPVDLSTEEEEEDEEEEPEPEPQEKPKRGRGRPARPKSVAEIAIVQQHHEDETSDAASASTPLPAPGRHAGSRKAALNARRRERAFHSVRTSTGRFARVAASSADEEEGEEGGEEEEGDEERPNAGTPAPGEEYIRKGQLPQTAEQWHILLRTYTQRALRYNSELVHERKTDRGLLYEPNINQSLFPVSELLRLSAEETAVGAYPAAALPGQYVDGCPRPAKAVGGSEAETETSSESEEEQEDAGTVDASARAASALAMRVPRAIPGRGRRARETGALCVMCNESDQLNREGSPEEFVHCSACRTYAHPSCIQVSASLAKVIRTYNWSCMDCKECSICGDGDEKQLLFCDCCDRGMHSYCVGIERIPKGRWVCDGCSQLLACESCGKKQAGEGAHTKWRHEYSRPSKEGVEPKFLQTLCTACSRQFRVGNFCPVCLKVYRNTEMDTPMVQCDDCLRWVHIACEDIDEPTYEAMSNSEAPWTCSVCQGKRPDRSRE